MNLSNPDNRETSEARVALQLAGVGKTYCSESGSQVRALEGIDMTVREANS